MSNRFELLTSPSSYLIFLSFFFFLFKPHVARTLIVVDRFALRMGFKGLKEDLRVGNLLGIWTLDLTMLLRNES